MNRPLLSLEPAAPDDVDALVRLERRCYSHPWTPDHFREALAPGAGGTRVVVLRGLGGRSDLDRGIAAYCVVQAVADELHVHNLAVRPESRGRGLGSFLLSWALGDGARRGAGRALLEVRAGNRAALELYRAFGFRTLAVRRAYYVQPVEDALVLVREDLGGPNTAPAPSDTRPGRASAAGAGRLRVEADPVEQDP